MELTIEQIQTNRIHRLKEARKNTNLSLTNVAKTIGVNRSTLVRWESGLIIGLKLPHLKRLAELYGVSEQWLFGYDVPRDVESVAHKTKRDEISSKLLHASDEDLERVSQMIDLLLNK